MIDLDALLALAFLTLVASPLVVALARANELAVIDIAQGALSLRRGRAPARLLSMLSDVATRPPIPRARLRILVENGRPMLRAPELPPDRLQRMRNVVGLFTVQQFRHAPR